MESMKMEDGENEFLGIEYGNENMQTVLPRRKTDRPSICLAISTSHQQRAAGKMEKTHALG